MRIPNRLLKIVFYSILLFITLYSLLPEEEAVLHESLKITQSGFFLHLAAYLVTTIMGRLAFLKIRQQKFIYLAVTIFVYSILLEGVQILVPSRSFNLFDIVANGLGVCIAVILAHKLKMIPD